ncbi:MAG TPA: DegT/DnrJ/EryC1/StrS family aminotransferase [Anaerolineales bacterium]|nr:DegT/DnrJ/EryC1/StrS family aminotransferase [Anaerolineales bacterium]
MGTGIPFVDLKVQYRQIKDEIDQAIQDVLDSGHFILGEQVEAFEAEFAAYCSAGQAVGVNSGTAAIQLALLACGIGSGDEVVTPSFTSVATVAAIELTGARPVLVDIDPHRCTLDPERVEAALTPRTRAVLPVHLYGCPADLDPLLGITRRRGLVLVEDCAQAHGALYKGRKVGSLGDIAAFSFYPTKNLGAYGDGGAVVTSDPALAARTRLLRQYGWENRRQVSKVRGLNSRLDDLQAAVLRVKLNHLDEWNTRREDLAHRYTELFYASELLTPDSPRDVRHAYHLYVVRHPRRDHLQAALAENGIQTLVHYPVPVHLQPAYRDLGYREGDLPHSEEAARQVLSLPLYPEMGTADLEKVAREILASLHGM